jgi:hypothetical protein
MTNLIPNLKELVCLDICFGGVLEVVGPPSDDSRFFGDYHTVKLLGHRCPSLRWCRLPPCKRCLV